MAFDLPQERLLAIIATQSEIASAALDLEGVMALVVSRAQGIIGADAAVIEMVEGEEMVYHAVCGAAAGHSGVRLAVDTSLSGLSLLLGEVLHCDDAESDPRVDRDAARRVGALSMVCVPLTNRGRAVGVLKVYSGRAHAFDAADVETLGLLSGLIASSMTRADEFQRQQHESRHDVLTGLPNRRAFDERFASEIARVARYGGELAIALAELDGLQHVQDTQGQGAGDAVLRAAGRNLAAVRGADASFRLGGAEFSLIFVGGGSRGATRAMYRLEDSVRADPACLGVAISWGVAEMREPDRTELLAMAGRALKAAKQAKAARAG